jgi:2-polyprenyl-3-methyl-5-hydroxy-6-metoxy-1,4-benzoquinol methylase
MSAQFDAIGAKYDPVKTFPAIQYGETFTVQKMLGDISGKRVIDLACGTGFYTRLLKRMGADTVIGVDISQEMLSVAKQQEAITPLGIKYVESDVVALPDNLGTFDVVLAVYLLNYAEHEKNFCQMLQKIYDLLAPGGQLIAYTVNPAFTLDKGDNSQYKFTVRYRDEEPPVPHRQPISVMVHLDTPIVVDNYLWDAKVYQKLTSQIGFRALQWHPLEVSPQGMEEYGQNFWHEYLDNSLVSGLSCVK